MLLAPNGLVVMSRQLVPMSRDQVSWLISGEAFLGNLEYLKTLKLAAYCAICRVGKQCEDVSATWVPERQVFIIRSACRAGEVTLAKARSLPLSELLAHLGWRLKCLECPRYDMQDGVQGDNEQTASRLTVICGCTERVFDAGGN